MRWHRLYNQTFILFTLQMTLIFHPSNITYDYSISKTWEQYRLKRKKNQNVKDFRLAIWMPEKWNYLVWWWTVEFNGETRIGKFAWFDIFKK